MLEPAGEDVSSSHTPDAQLADALRPAVTVALRAAVQDEPRMWAEALFPALLPAVRMAVTAALRGMVQTLNQVLEQSLSLRSWRWRLEAWRTGKTFGEVVLLRTLVYRVEQLLLLDRQAGLLLASAPATHVVARDDQLIAAMLTALQDFVSDSFEVQAEGGIRELHVGEFTLLVETGPKATLVAAVRGNAPAELRETVRAAIDLIHQEFVAELRDFRGDPKPFERAKTILEGCLQAQYRRQETHSSTKLWVLAAVIVALLGSWIGLRLRDARRWERAVAALRNTRGIAITESGRHGGRYVLEGLQDPLASRPELVLRNGGIDLRKVSLHFEPYLSLDPELVIQRARMLLDPPGSVSASLDSGTLKLAGTAPHAWIIRARTAGAELNFLGIRTVDANAVADQNLQALGAEIESAGILFDIDSSALTGEQIRAGKTLAAKSREWFDYARELGRAPRLTVLGYADPTGREERNQNLSRQRAEHLAALLFDAGIAPDLVSAEGRGNSAEEVASALQRRAVIRLALENPVRSER